MSDRRHSSPSAVPKLEKRNVGIGPKSTGFLTPWKASGAYYIPSELAEEGVIDVHQWPLVAGLDKHIQGRRDAKTAYDGYPYLEINPPHVFTVIPYDIDRARTGYPMPPPNWIVVNELTGRYHAVYVLAAPVYRGEYNKALRYLADISDKLAVKLGADPSYNQQLTRNPINPGPDVFTSWASILLLRFTPYTLEELAAAVKGISKPKERQTGFGRNCDLFGAMVSDAHRPRWAEIIAAEYVLPVNAPGPQGDWWRHVHDSNIGFFGEAALPLGEVGSISRSCARYSLRQYGRHHQTASGKTYVPFGELQARRGRRGMGKRWHDDAGYDFEGLRVVVKCMRGTGMTQGEVATAAGISQQHVSRILKVEGDPLYGLEGLRAVQERNERIRDLNAEGVPVRTIADYVGLSKSQANRIIWQGEESLSRDTHNQNRI